MARNFPISPRKDGAIAVGLWLCRGLAGKWGAGVLLAGMAVGLGGVGAAPAAAAPGEGARGGGSLVGEWRVTPRAALHPPPGARGEVVVVATSDLHGWVVRDTLYPEQRPGGLAHLAPVIEALRRESPHMVLLDGGDLMQGAPNLSLALRRPDRPPPVLALMNRLGYDAIALGNHDLEQGRGALARWVSQTAFPWLSGNAVLPGGGPLLAPYRVLERGGVRIGVLGLTTPGVPAWVDPAALEGLHFPDMETAARRWLPVLREVERADVVVGLFHAGLQGAYDRAMAVRLGLPLPNGAGRIADGLAGFDLIISGHSHQLGPARPAGGESPYTVAVLQPGARGEALAVGRIQVRERDGRWRVTGLRRELLPPTVRPHAGLMAVVAPDLAATRAWLAEPSGVRFTAVPEPETFFHCAGALSHGVLSHGVLSHDAAMGGAHHSSPAGGPPQKAVAGGAAEIPRQAFSLLPMLWRTELPAPEEVGAPLRRAHLHRWMRYDNSLVLASLTARQMALLLGPYVRWARGLRTRATLVLHPGGFAPRVAPEGTEVLELTAGSTGRVLPPHQAFPVWLTNYHWNGGGGLVATALVHPGQRVAGSPQSLRERIFALLLDGPGGLPPPCRIFLG